MGLATQKIRGSQPQTAMSYVTRAFSRSRMPLLGEGELGSQELADQIFLNLAADRERKAVHEAHVARHLVVRNLPAAKFPDFLIGGGHAGSQADARADGLTVLGIGNTD